MASPSWGTNTPVADLVLTNAWEFGFFQAVRLLARMYNDRKLVGATASPRAEIVHFQAKQSLEFPASEVHSIEPNGGGPVHMTVAFMGLTGIKGTLPAYYTDLVLNQEMQDDDSFAAFLDVFNHRLVSLFYRAWDKHHFIAGYERSLREGLEDSFTGYLFALIGMGTGGLRKRLRFPDQALLRYAGLIAQRPHSASALAGLLRDYFEVPVEVDQFCGRWHALELQELSYLDSEGIHNQLGVGAIAGDAVWTQQGVFRVRFGPLPFRRFREFLPDGEAFRTATDLIRYFANRALEFEIQPVLMATEVPWPQLTDETPESPRLGWSAWLKTRAFEEDAADAMFAGDLDGFARPGGIQ
ncbi:MAG TPA: type VI secretion system baseplate subunit TssG [Bryobacteraceae bacterium]|nr:type VI secretion system baseplate subunit TssG [Bryobacteraceae bacterium]